MVPTADEFFEQQAGRSLAKSAIVSKYVLAWAWILAREDHLVYLDLLAGPGIYDDGSLSTPLLILQEATSKERIGDRLECLFNDRDASLATRLQACVDKLDGVGRLTHKPRVTCSEVGPGTLAEWAMRIGDLPTLLFLDPWGYKEIALSEIDRFIGPWGSECVFFFNYRRVNAAVSNTALQRPTDTFFGTERARELRAALHGARTDERERMVFEAVESALKDRYGRYVLRFRLAGGGAGADYYLVHVTKAWKGHEVMRNIMAGVSDKDEDGVPWFEYNPDRRPALFRVAGGLNELQASLLADPALAGRTHSFGELFGLHSPGRMYTAANYKEVLRRLVVAGDAVVDYDEAKLARGQLPERVNVTIHPGR